MMKNVKKFKISVSDVDKAWKEFFENRPEPKTDREAIKQEKEFAYWYNNVRKQPDTGKTPIEMGERILHFGIDDLEEDKTFLEECIQNGEYAEALSIADDLLKKEPQNPEFLFKKAEILTMLDRFDEAEKLVDECLNSVPENPDFYLNKAMIVLSRSKFQDVRTALEWVDKGLERKSGYFDLLAAKANYLYWLKDSSWKEWLQKAEIVDKKRAKNFKKNFWLERQPTIKQVENPGRKLHLAMELSKLGDFKKGLETFSEIPEVREMPEMKAMVLGLEIDNLLAQRKVEEAKPKIQEILKIKPKDPHAHLYTTIVACTENRWEDALTTINLCIKYAEENELEHPDYYMCKASILKKLNTPGVEEYKKLARLTAERNKVLFKDVFEVSKDE